jgi:hypothetical protein
MHARRRLLRETADGIGAAKKLGVLVVHDLMVMSPPSSRIRFGPLPPLNAVSCLSMHS